MVIRITEQMLVYKPYSSHNHVVTSQAPSHLIVYTGVALGLHEYQYHVPDPACQLSPYPTRESAAKDTQLPLAMLTRLVKDRVKPRLEQEGV